MRNGGLAVDFRGNAERDAASGERVSEPVGIVASIGEHGPGWRQHIDEHGRALEVAGLSFAQRQADRAAAAVANGMKFGGQAATATPDTSG